MNIYVSNLSFHTTDEDLKTMFSKFGEVTSVKIIFDKVTNRSRGFGFIEMCKEILYMINYACEAMDCKSKTEAGRMEILLHEKLPLEVKSQNSVYSWLQKEYNLVLKEQ